MRQAIETKFISGSERFPCGRISARCQAGRVLVEVNSQLSEDDNHLAAAKALMAKFGWDEWATGLAAGGSADGKGNVYVVLGPERVDDDTIIPLRDPRPTRTYRCLVGQNAYEFEAASSDEAIGMCVRDIGLAPARVVEA
jgi:hypothetical protein